MFKERLVKLLQADADKLLYSLQHHLTKIGYKNIISQYPYYVLGQGNIPILLVAHTDTVHPNPPTNIFYDQEKQVLWSPDGLGADDRAGIYAILELLHKDLRPHVLFTNYEEIGALGAQQLTQDYPEIPPIIKNTKYVIQLDRRGNDDCVFYNCDNQDFINYIKNFGFAHNIGTFTDITVICSKWNVAGVNLSIGYYNEHSTSEYLLLTELNATINKVGAMLKNPPTQKFIYTTETKVEKDYCHNCYEIYDINKLIYLEDEEAQLCSHCYKCLVEGGM